MDNGASVASVWDAQQLPSSPMADVAIRAYTIVYGIWWIQPTWWRITKQDIQFVFDLVAARSLACIVNVWRSAAMIVRLRVGRHDIRRNYAEDSQF